MTNIESEFIQGSIQQNNYMFGTYYFIIIIHTIT